MSKKRKPKPKQRPRILPGREKPLAGSTVEQIRTRQRREQLQAGLDRRVSKIARDFRGGRRL